MSDFSDLLDEAHAQLDDADPATINIEGITPAAGCACTLWPVDGDLADSSALNYRPISSKVSIRRILISELPEIGTPVSVGGRVYMIASIKSDTVSVELDLQDIRQQ